MSLKIGNVELHMGPKGLGGDDLEKPIIDFIDGTKRYLDIAVQELDNENIRDAILRARARNITVKLVLEADYLRAKTRHSNPLKKGGSHEINRQIQNAILRSKAYVYSDFNPKIFHQKFVVRDRKAVLTGSTNFTDTGTHKNLNHILIIHNEKVAKEYWREFKEISKGRFGKESGAHQPVPKEVAVSNLRIKVLFAPDNSPELEIVKQMAKARQRVDFAIFTFSKSSGIDDQMYALLNAGVKVRGIFDRRPARQVWAPWKELKNAGAEVYTVGTHPGLGKLHHKLMVIDKQVVIAGSMNYTGPANTINDENILVIGKKSTTKTAEKNAQQQLATHAFNEIDRIIRKYKS